MYIQESVHNFKYSLIINEFEREFPLKPLAWHFQFFFWSTTTENVESRVVSYKHGSLFDHTKL